jgi:hypothetical protein
MHAGAAAGSLKPVKVQLKLTVDKYYLQHERPCCIGYTNSSRRREFVYPIQHGRECCKFRKQKAKKNAWKKIRAAITSEKKIRASKQQSTNSLEKKFLQRLNALKKNPAET